MEAIDKAAVSQFREQVAVQQKQAQDQLVATQQTLLRLQGGLAACDYILALDPITIDPEDEVTEDDLKDLASYVVENPIEASEAAVLGAP